MSLGIHVSKTMEVNGKSYKTILSGLKGESKGLNLSAISLFIIGPRNSKLVSMDYNNIDKYCIDNDITIWPHGSYTTAGIWNVTEKNINTEKSKAAIDTILSHLTTGEKLSAKGVVIHLPRHDLDSIIETMHILSNEIDNSKPSSPYFTIEMPASKPSETLTYETPEKLNKLVKVLSDDKDITLKWNLCIDTCHLWAGGINIKKWNLWKNDLSKDTKNKINLIHLNGAEARNFGTGKDHHITPLSLEDAIWGSLISKKSRDQINMIANADLAKTNLYDILTSDEHSNIKKSSLNSIVKFAKLKNISMIMEIKSEDYLNMKLALDVINHLLS
jgi:deoxyribonuclease-4